MTAIYARILEVLTTEKQSGWNKLLISIGTTRMSGDKTQIDSLHKRGHPKVWSLTTTDQAIDSLSISMEKRCVLSKNKEVAKCVIPLDWFPANRIVRDWFPLQQIRNNENSDISTQVLLEIHLENRGASKFSAPFANMRVIPTWQRPDRAFNAISAPQSISVTPVQLPNGSIEYVTIGVSQYPTIEQLQHPTNLTIDHVRKHSPGVNIPPILDIMTTTPINPYPVMAQPPKQASIYAPPVPIQICPE